MAVELDAVRSFWEANPCGSANSDESDRAAYFADIERRRYSLEPHILEVADFASFADRDVLEIGCGVGTDGAQFARHGARYVGTDLTDAAIDLAQEQFALANLQGTFVRANAEQLPFDDESFDHLYSWGVIHHTPDTEQIVGEMYRVLRPGGTICVMVYNRTSINYHIEIMLLRKIFREFLRVPGALPALARALGVPRAKLERHRELLFGERKLSKERWISMNTDGPDCPLAKVYSAAEAKMLFRRFAGVTTGARFFNREHWPLIGSRLPEGAVRSLGDRWGWHRFVTGTKPH